MVLVEVTVPDGLEPSPDDGIMYMTVTSDGTAHSVAVPEGVSAGQALQVFPP